ncbi:hypothetical protein BN7_3944 [Wickerhamomyces ciferrii]|uniref:Uncharacterized protein n=1 Tax=Wickerhamomyces ciferrii (strain ATCC 14091 / BCRC 22168 / CBS 111 / JCM 3599 / NBRC 0793 / NRRL Y-1031 F-60-10) TaxID=1206466 RepID=K0KN31_WICCF|nr:uncharacterized protein BN7_3944 [Wickerhamomyces ciferrii]CCH44381.1 hypothetical protein BN7_3944 [Wickerhamomyces ciferrii]
MVDSDAGKKDVGNGVKKEVVKREKMASIADLPRQLIRDIVVKYADIKYESLLKVYQLDQKVRPVLLACAVVVTNDYSVDMRSSIQSVAGLGLVGKDGSFDIYHIDDKHIVKRLKQYCFIYISWNHMKSSQGLVTQFPTIKEIGYRAYRFNENFRERALFYSGNKEHETFPRSDPSVELDLFKRCGLYTNAVLGFDEYSSLTTGKNVVKFQANMMTRLSLIISTVNFNIKDINLPNLKILDITTYKTKIDEEIINKSTGFNEKISVEMPKHRVVPIFNNSTFSLSGCYFPKVETFTINQRILRIGSIKNCDFSSLRELEFNNNFLLIIEDTNFTNLEKLIIRPTINTESYHEKTNNTIVTGDQFDLDLGDFIQKFCERFGFSKDRIKKFPSIFAKGNTFKSLKHLQVPHINSLMTAKLPRDVMSSLEKVIIDPKPNIVK